MAIDRVDLDECPDTAPSRSSQLPGADILGGEQGEAPIVVTGSREQLFHLLAEAAEIEHCLMCSYLYAAFSLKSAAHQDFSAEQAEAVARWRKAIIDVAVEEMGHLVIIANLTTAIGGRPHLSRPNFPIAPGYFPSGVVVRLSGFSLETLEHFIFLERPKGSPQDDAGGYQQEDYSRQQTHLGLMANAQHYSTIGFLYEAIRENLKRLAESLGEDVLFTSPNALQLAAPVIDMPGVERVAKLQDALAGIDLIVDQGEGSPEDREGTHYRAFIGIRDEYERMMRANPQFTPAWPVADNPVLRCPPEPEDKTYIDHPKAAKLLDFTCAAYGLLLRVLSQCFGDQSGGRAQQEKLFSTAIVLMHVLSAASSALAEIPASNTETGKHAGMSFTMLRGVEPLLAGETGYRLLGEQLERLKQGADQEDFPDSVRKMLNDFAM